MLPQKLMKKIEEMWTLQNVKGNFFKASIFKIMIYGAQYHIWEKGRRIFQQMDLEGLRRKIENDNSACLLSWRHIKPTAGNTDLGAVWV